MPRRGVPKHTAEYWCIEEIAELRREALRARRSYVRKRRRDTKEAAAFREVMREVQSLLRSAINRSKKECRTKLCAEVDEDTWGLGDKITMKRLIGQYPPQTKSAAQTRAIVITIFPTHRKMNWIKPDMEGNKSSPWRNWQMLKES